MNGAGGDVRTIAVFGGGQPRREMIAAHAPGWQVLDGAGLDDAGLAAAEVVFGWSFAKAAVLLAPGSALKWVQTGSTGVDFLPLAELQAKGVTVTSARGVHAEAVAETALALMLAVARGFTYAAKNAQKRQWPHDAVPMTRFCELRGKTVCILGTGSIGRRLAGLCAAFEMRVLGVSHSGAAVPGFAWVAPAAACANLLAESNFVANALPLTPETAGFVNAARLEQCKPGAVYVSVGRGKTTDTAALVAALQSGRLVGAGLDVTDPEPLPPDSPLWAMDNVLVLPHYAGWSRENEARAEALFLRNLAAYLKTGKPAENVVDYTAGY